MNKIKKYLGIMLGCAITSIAIGVCYVPNKIVNGGVSGLSTVFYHILNVPTGVTYGVINIILLSVALVVLGRKFVVDSLFGAAAITVFVQLASYLPPLTDNMLLASVFGGVLYGIGIAITLVVGSNTGGTDILARLIQHRFTHLSMGTLLMVIDGIVIGASLCVFLNVNLVLYGIIALGVTTFTIDRIVKMLNISKLAFVITDKGEEISHLLISTSPRGVTKMQIVGAYSNADKMMLMCALKSHEAQKFQNSILSVDDKAFIIFSESQQIVGNGFSVYK